MTEQHPGDLGQHDDDWMPGLVEAPDLDVDDYATSPDLDAIPIVDVSTLPDANPAETLDAQDDMDDTDLEGLGSADTQPICRRAVPIILDKCHTAAPNQAGYCLREVRIPNETPSKYLDALQSLIAADVKWDITHNWSKGVRGQIGYMRGDPNTHPHGHVFEIFGNGWIGTTDSPLGHWGRVKGDELLDRWGYEQAFASPFVNDNRVWRPKRVHEDPKPTPADRRLQQFQQWRDELQRRHRGRVSQGDVQRAHVLEARIQIITRLIKQAKEHHS